ncbi:MAG: heme biosynthesis HemY N-terminal domain-containing protein [Porticoccaceae bacterium]
MRRAFFLTALALLGGGLLYWLMARENGFILIAVGGQMIQLSLWMAVLVVLILVQLWRALAWFYRRWIKRAVGRGQSARQMGPVRYRARTVRGLTEFFEARWERARRTLERGAGRSDIPHINYWAAAAAAAELRDWTAVRALLAKADESGGGGIASLLTEGKMLIAEGQAQAALVCLRQIQVRLPGHPPSLGLIEQIYRDRGDWLSLEQLLPALRSAKVYSGDQMRALEAEIYAGLLRGAGGDGVGQVAGGQLEGVWKRVPKAVRHLPRVVAAYAELLHKGGQADRADKELRRHLNQYWDAELILLYGQLGGVDSRQQLVVAEAWNRQWPDSAELLLTLGRLCKRNQLWGKAREYLEQSLRLSPRLETYAELAALMADMGEPGKSHDYYRLGVEQCLRVGPACVG